MSDFAVQFTLLSSPHESDGISTALRLVRACLDSGARVRVWACGNATFLTSEDLESLKPRNVFLGDATYPTTAALVAELCETYGSQLDWAVCHFCSHDRGAVRHISGVRMRPAMFFNRFVEQAAKTITVGRL